MKVFFDTCVYAAEALLGAGAEEMVAATQRASWKIFASAYLLDELDRVLTAKLGFSHRLSYLSRRRIIRRSLLIDPPTSRHHVADDSADSPILQAALAAGSDYLITNDAHLLALNPYEGLRIISMTDYYRLSSRKVTCRNGSLRHPRLSAPSAVPIRPPKKFPKIFPNRPFLSPAFRPDFQLGIGRLIAPPIGRRAGRRENNDARNKPKCCH